MMLGKTVGVAAGYFKVLFGTHLKKTLAGFELHSS
jgi:hypothetical protein